MANREEDSVKQTATSAQDEMLICIQGTRGTDISGSLVQRSQCALLHLNKRPDIFLKGHLRNNYVCTIVSEQKTGACWSQKHDGIMLTVCTDPTVARLSKAFLISKL